MADLGGKGSAVDDAYVESKRVHGEPPFTPEQRADILARRDGTAGLSPDEARVDALILDAMNGIFDLNGRRLRANQAELAQAVHVLQGFVRQSACHRLGLFSASDWWEDKP